MTTILSLAAIVAFLVLFVAYKFHKAKQEIEQVLKVKEELEQKNQAQQVEIQTQKRVIKNAEIKDKNQQTVSRSNASTVDQQLHEKGYLRD